MPSKPEAPLIPERAQHILRALVEEYIRSGQPVGSRTLSKMPQIHVSPATIRNVMGDLEELGYLASPHPSAGRVPTELGYRMFVDTLIHVKSLDANEIRKIQTNFDAGLNPDELLKTASNHLSEMTRMAGIVTIPRHEEVVFDQLEFVPLSDQRILVVLVTNEKEIQNRIIKANQVFSRSELEQAANFINRQFAGQGLTTMRDAIKKELESTRTDMHDHMTIAIEMASSVLTQDGGTSHDDVIVAGQTNLMTSSDLSNVELLKNLFDSFNQKQSILHLLEHSIAAEGVSIFIGHESGHEMLDEYSVVTAPYGSEGEVIGMLGVIGPTRMAYERIIPIVDITSKLLGVALNSK